MSASLWWRNGLLLFMQLSLLAAPSTRGHVPQSHINASPCQCDKGFQPLSRPEGLGFSTGLFQSSAPFALEINVIQQKLQEKVKYQQQNMSLG